MFILILCLIESPCLSDILSRFLHTLPLVFGVDVLKGVSALQFCISVPCHFHCELHTQSVGDSKILFSRLVVSLPVSRAVCVSGKIVRMKVGVTFI
jgi:hypothetical protein